MNRIVTLGIDLAKSVFQLHGVDSAGHMCLRKQVRRVELLRIIAQLAPCLIGMEACASAHYWARKFRTYGHDVKLMSPQYVRPYVKSQKNDQRDAEAICEAVTRPNMRFVPPKSLEQQDLQMAHRVRQGWMSERTALVNRIRGLLGEYGVVLARSPGVVKRELPRLLEDVHNELTTVSRALLAQMLGHLRDLEERVRDAERMIDQRGSQHDTVKRFQSIPGIGPLTATALVAATGDAKVFKNGRQMAAWLGLVPRQFSSGGKTRLLGIGQRGDKYLRCLLVMGLDL
jgi:transposase